MRATAVSSGVRWMNRLFCLAGILGFTFSAMMIQAEPRIVEETQYYEIEGLTPRDLSSQMKTRGPKGFSGYTQWKTDYQFRTRSEGQACAVASVSVTVRLTYTMPKWTNESQASPDLRAQWVRFYCRLTDHETGHADLAVKNARLIEQGLLGLKASSCRELDEQCNRTARFFLDETNRGSADYDRQTDHGRAQGAHFP